MNNDKTMTEGAVVRAWASEMPDRQTRDLLEDYAADCDIQAARESAYRCTASSEKGRLNDRQNDEGVPEAPAVVVSDSDTH